MSSVPALLGYQLALLLRSQRWLAPLLLYAALLAISVQWGQPLLDGLGYAAAVLLPVAAWLVRVCVTGEPDAARSCTAAAAGPWRAHVASLLASLVASVVLAVAGTLYVVVASDPHSTDGRVDVPVPAAATAGLLASLACALIGTAVGTLCNRPLLRRTGWAVPSMLLAVLLVLVSGASPANAAVQGLVTGSHSGQVATPWLPLALSLLATAAAGAVAAWLAPRRH